MGSYDTTIGPLLIGIFFNTFLYGLVSYQFAVYYSTKFNDPLTTRCMVFFLFLVDTFHSASLIYMTWSNTVTYHDDPLVHAEAGWVLAFTPLATALAGLVTQIYLGFRIWRFTNSKILYGVVFLLAIPSFALGVTYSIALSTNETFYEAPRFDIFLILWSSTQVAVDMFIAMTLGIVFNCSRTGLEMDTILNRFICCAVQTGFFACAFSLCNLITFVVSPRTTLFAVFGIPLGRIYTNTLMDTILTRRRLVKMTNGGATVTQTIRIEFDSVLQTPIDTQAISMI